MCPACDGRGVKVEHPCATCQGRGDVVQEQSLVVKIPKGVEDGLVLRIPGKGMSSPETGGVPGDLFVVVRTAPDARFERSGADLLRVETISVVDAVLGTVLKVPTLEGFASVSVPPGAQPDAVLRLKSQGLPAFEEKGRGDMFLRIGVQVPEKLTRAERELYEKLRALATVPKP
jgi:molecular chaperone DnaJ